MLRTLPVSYGSSTAASTYAVVSVVPSVIGISIEAVSELSHPANIVVVIADIASKLTILLFVFLLTFTRHALFLLIFTAFILSLFLN